MTSSSVTSPSPRPSLNAKPELVVASALKPSPSSTRAAPASHGLGMTNGSPWCRARNAAPLSAWSVMRGASGAGQHLGLHALAAAHRLEGVAEAVEREVVGEHRLGVDRARAQDQLLEDQPHRARADDERALAGLDDEPVHAPDGARDGLDQRA